MDPLTFDAFLNAFPLFEDVAGTEKGATLIESKLAMAHASYGGCAGYPQYYGIIGNHTAHLLCIEPGGHTMKVDSDGNTVYSMVRDTLLLQVPRTGVVVE